MWKNLAISSCLVVVRDHLLSFGCCVVCFAVFAALLSLDALNVVADLVELCSFSFSSRQRIGHGATVSLMVVRRALGACCCLAFALYVTVQQAFHASHRRSDHCYECLEMRHFCETVEIVDCFFGRQTVLNFDSDEAARSMLEVVSFVRFA